MQDVGCDLLQKESTSAIEVVKRRICIDIKERSAKGQKSYWVSAWVGSTMKNRSVYIKMQ